MRRNVAPVEEEKRKTFELERGGNAPWVGNCGNAVMIIVVKGNIHLIWSCFTTREGESD